MDIELLKTFLEVHRTRHFGRAADNQFLTQSAVSARVRLLEDTLRVQLFTRDRNNIQLTPAGARFLHHAESILNAWNRACQDVALEEERKTPFAVGGIFSLWDIMLQEWIQILYTRLPDIALQADANGAEILVRKIREGVLDIAFLFEAPQLAELTAQEVAAIELIMVASRPGLSAAQAVTAPDYVMVDWGTSFAMAHARHFSDMPAPGIRMGLGRLAWAFILECGGVAYLAKKTVIGPLEEKRLFPVEDAPVIERQVYAVFAHASPRKEMLGQTLTHIPSGSGIRVLL